MHWRCHNLRKWRKLQKKFCSFHWNLCRIQLDLVLTWVRIFCVYPCFPRFFLFSDCRQECIPVGCCSSQLVGAGRGICPGGGRCLPGGEVSAQGGSAWRGVCLSGGVGLPGRCTTPLCTDRHLCKHHLSVHLSSLLLRTVKTCFLSILKYLAIIDFQINFPGSSLTKTIYRSKEDFTCGEPINEEVRFESSINFKIR